MTPSAQGVSELIRQAPAAAAPSRRWRRVVPTLLLPVLAVPVDAAAIPAAFWLAYQLRFGGWMLALFPAAAAAIPSWSGFARDLQGIVPLWLLLFHSSAGLYKDEELAGEDRFLKVAKGCLFGVLATLAF